MRQAQTLEPLALIVNAALGWVHYYAGNYEQALAQYRSTIELDSTFVLAYLWRGQAEEMAGRSDDAVASFRRAVDLSGRGGIFVAALARSLALRGEVAEAERLLAELETARTVPAFEVAKVHESLGRRAQALAWLDRAIEDRSHSMVFLRVDPELDWLRADPAFPALARRVGL